MKEWNLFELNITETISHVLQKEVHMFQLWIMFNMQSLNNKEWKLFELDITETKHNLSILIRKNV